MKDEGWKGRGGKGGVRPEVIAGRTDLNGIWYSRGLKDSSKRKEGRARNLSYLRINTHTPPDSRRRPFLSYDSTRSEAEWWKEGEGEDIKVCICDLRCEGLNGGGRGG